MIYGIIIDEGLQVCYGDTLAPVALYRPSGETLAHFPDIPGHSSIFSLTCLKL
jgi:hypothetical protein